MAKLHRAHTHSHLCSHTHMCAQSILCLISTESIQECLGLKGSGGWPTDILLILPSPSLCLCALFSTLNSSTPLSLSTSLPVSQPSPLLFLSLPPPTPLAVEWSVSLQWSALLLHLKNINQCYRGDRKEKNRAPHLSSPLRLLFPLVFLSVYRLNILCSSVHSQLTTVIHRENYFPDVFNGVSLQ